MDRAGVSTGEAAKLRVFFIPFFASGHIIPMTDLARLFAARPGVEPTMVVTPANAALIRPTLDRSAASGSHVGLLLYPFPSADAGIPPGIENLASVAPSDEWRIYKAVDLVRDAHDRILRDHRPDAVVADIPFWWTTFIARDLGIPRITFHAVGVFPQCVMNNIQKHRTHEGAAGERDPFTVPELPGPPIELVRSELPTFLRSGDHLSDAWENLKKAQLESYGVVVNTFYELESAYCDLFRRTDCRKAWFPGPLALSYDSDGKAEAERGGGLAENRDRCLSWLEAQKPGSVVFVCFGSWCHFSAEQLREMATGLEASGKPFLWVVRDVGGAPFAAEEWMPEGWEGRVEDRGLVVRGWAPQVAILGHPAVGAFVTHCGWNSVLEAVAAGVPMLTWPLVFEQFINERLVVGVMGAGARVWDGFRSTEEGEKVVVPGEVIGSAVSRFMEEEGTGAAARLSVLEYAALARSAVAEGGSSHRDINGLIDELMAMVAHQKEMP